MSLILRRKEDPEQSKFDLKFIENTDLNITESCLRNCILTYQSWNAMPNFLIEAGTDNNLVVSNSDPLANSRKTKFSNSLNSDGDTSDEEGVELANKGIK
jgi:hypothetical protein